MKAFVPNLKKNANFFPENFFKKHIQEIDIESAKKRKKPPFKLRILNL